MSPAPVLWGAAVAAVLLLAGWQPWRRGGERRFGPLAGALAGPAAVLTALYVNGSSLKLPPREFLDWVLLAGLAAVPLGLLRLGSVMRALVGAVAFAAGAAFLYGHPTAALHERYWGGEVVRWVGVLAGATTIAYLLHHALLARPTRRTEGSFALAASAFSAAPALGFTGAGGTALLVAALAAAPGFAGLMGIVRRDLPIGRGLSAPVSALAAGLLANGVLYAETPWWAALTLLFAPQLVQLPGGRGWKGRVVRLALVAAACGSAAFLVRGEPSPYGAYGY